ncbi:Rpn family recombination-promoting nuclease/putative transposase [Pedobacter africanus]|uniref:Rpn family recombination-promoting nuclease/putative transposase n=1 Tax=Pedobacter africanus TaxID=151894 RepID=UPI0021CE9CF1|nr:Rpn family recombination-promoting nuclease/putative transposase [Pedobacter africanus]
MLYCTGDNNENFIVEMQKGNQEHFKDRILFYTANLVQGHGKSVEANWDYKLPEVYKLFVANFPFSMTEIRLLELLASM